MKEVKSPKKPLIYYYGIVLLVLLLFNILVAPLLLRQQVIEVDYGTFMNMIDEEILDSIIKRSFEITASKNRSKKV